MSETREELAAWAVAYLGETLRMRGYYFQFAPTGVVEVDRVLSAIACAGKGYHHTEFWSEEDEWKGGHSYIDLIQGAAYALAARLLEGK